MEKDLIREVLDYYLTKEYNEHMAEYVSLLKALDNKEISKQKYNKEVYANARAKSVIKQLREFLKTNNEMLGQYLEFNKQDK